MRKLSTIVLQLTVLLAFATVVHAGTITVTVGTDGANRNDGEITLREALLIANGSRTPFSSNDVPDEVAHVNGAVGAGVADTINVPASVGAIVLTSVLPPLDDSTDGIFAASSVVLNGSALPGTPGALESDFAFDIRTDGHTIIGFTPTGFPETVIRIRGANNTIRAMVIRNPGGGGIKLSGAGATGNTISNCVVDGAEEFGIVLVGGPKNNILDSVFVYNGKTTGIVFLGAGTDGNFVYGSAIGLTETLAPAGNGGFGIDISGGAKNNRIGDPNNLSSSTFISNNTLGGIEISESGTDGNILHSLWLGFDSNNPAGVGNGALGDGITVTEGAKGNKIGQPGSQALFDAGQEPAIVISGHINGIVVDGVGTTGNDIQKVFIGGPNPSVPGGKMKQKGHGIVVSDGAGSMFIGGPVEFTQVEINYTTGRPADPSPKHAIFINGSNSSTPVKDIVIGTMHLGNERANETAAVFTGDGVRITGNVDGVTIGAKGHQNNINGATGYGVILDGPNVKNIKMYKVHVGLYDNMVTPNEMGGIMIRNGASGVTVGDMGDDARCYVAHNNGTGITIDASGAAPKKITIQNTFVGLDSAETAAPNKGDGVLVKGPGAAAAVLSGIRIGRIKDDAGADTFDLGNVISSNEKTGVKVMNVSGVQILGNNVGTSTSDQAKRPNMEQPVWITDGATNTLVEKNNIHFGKEYGILVSGAKSKQNKFTNNSIALNTKDGIKLEDGANEGVEPPIVSRLPTVLGARAPSISGTTKVAGGTIEVFVDPIPLSDEDGYFGQGDERIQVTKADAKGEFSIPLAFNKLGIITATVTDAKGNTSGFSPFMQGVVIQTVQTKDNLLVAKKPTVVRLFADTGKGIDTPSVTSELTINDGAAIAPEVSPFTMRPLFGYAARLADSKKAKNTMNFDIGKPAAGMQSMKVVMKEGDKERGELDMGSFEYKTIDSFAVAFVPVEAPNQTDIPLIGPLEKPSLTQIQKALDYFAAVFPFDPVAFKKKSKVLPSVKLRFHPHFGVTSDGRLPNVIRAIVNVEVARSIGEGASKTKFRYGVGVVSDKSRLDPLGTPGITKGLTAPSIFPKAVLILDRDPLASAVLTHTADVLLHEIGHTPPFRLGDTYVNAAATPRAINPVDATRNIGEGNLIFESENAFSPKRNIIDLFGLKGPVWFRLTDVAANRISDLMGNRPPGWADSITYKVLFDKMAAAAAAGGKTRFKQTNTNAVVQVSPAIAVQGTVDTSDVVDALRVDRFTESIDRLELPTDVGDLFTVELQDASGAVLDSQVFASNFELHVISSSDTGEPTSGPGATDTMPFSVVLEDDPAAARIVVKKGSTVLATLEPSPSAPVVTGIGPNGPGDLSGDVEVSWTASDADPGDSDNLTVDVLYTPDDGQTLVPVATNLTGVASVTVGTDALPGGDTARFIVRASDGWTRTEAQSDPAFQVSDRLPTVEVSVDSSTFSDDVPQGLFVAAYDAEDGFLLEDAIQWLLDGVAIASGSTPNVMLPAGAHTLKAVATDSAGNAVSSEVNIVVAQFQDIDTDADGLVDSVDNCPELANADQADADLDGIGDACDEETTAIDDLDGDGISDGVDNCPNHANADQADGDGNGLGDVCDGDVDSDGIPDSSDNCVGEFNPTQDDADGDGIGDPCELVAPTGGGGGTGTGSGGNGTRDCGAGMCGAGATMIMPLMLLSLTGMKWNLLRRRRIRKDP